MQSLLATGTFSQYAIFFIYIAVLVGIAVFSRKKSKTINEFMFANKGVGGWLSAFAYGATYFSAVVFVGYAGKFGWNFGMAAVWIGIGNMLIGTLVAWKLLARRTKLITSELGARTMPELFEKRYESKYLKLIASLIIFVFLMPYASSVYQGLGYIFSSILGLDEIYCILILAAVTALYLFMGGYFATSLTDFFQGCIMIVGVVLCILTLLGSDVVGWSDGLRRLTESGKGLIPAVTGGDGSLFASPLFNVIILVLLTSFGIWGLPQSVHKFYAIKDDKAIKQGMVISTVFALIVGAGAYFMGGLVTLFVSPETFADKLGGNFDKLIPEMINSNLAPALLGLVVVLLFSASMSTLASLSLSSASTVSVDFYKGYVKKDASDKKITLLMRVLCLVFVALSALMAIFKIEAIVSMMSLSWGVISGCFIGPYVLGLYSKKVNRAGVYASIITTLTITVVLVSILGLSRTPFIGVVSMASSFIVTPVFSMLFPKCAIGEDLEKRIFGCVKRTAPQAAPVANTDGEQK